MTSKPLQNMDLNDSYLSTLSPKDKPWDKHKLQATKVERLYHNSDCQVYADRMGTCSNYLGFKWAQNPDTGELRLRLNAAKFCRVRHCPICQWRKSLMWMARFIEVLPVIVKEYPKHRYIFLTLTVKNCDIRELKQTLKRMNEAWQRMIQRKSFPAVGFVKSTEITKSADGLAHPHFHAVLMVEPGYFAGKNYLKQSEWTEIWKSCLRIDYTPVVNVKSVKNTPRRHGKGVKRTDIPTDGSDASQRILEATDAISRGLMEVCKYSVKPEDAIGTGSDSDRDWLLELTNQLYKTRSIAVGGILKNYLSEKDPEDYIGNEVEEGDTGTEEKDISDDESDGDRLSDITFGWRERLAKYTSTKDS